MPRILLGVRHAPLRQGPQLSSILGHSSGFRPEVGPLTASCSIHTPHNRGQLHRTNWFGAPCSFLQTALPFHGQAFPTCSTARENTRDTRGPSIQYGGSPGDCSEWTGSHCPVGSHKGGGTGHLGHQAGPEPNLGSTLQQAQRHHGKSLGWVVLWVPLIC